jgi:hypothetical protein
MAAQRSLPDTRSVEKGQKKKPLLELIFQSRGYLSPIVFLTVVASKDY